MKLVSASLALAATLTLCEASPAPHSSDRGTHVVHEKRSEASSPWVKGPKVDKDAILPIRIGLTQSNLENGYDHLMDVYVSSSCQLASQPVVVVLTGAALIQPRPISASIGLQNRFMMPLPQMQKLFRQ